MRTIEQLGYVVWATESAKRDALGIRFLVQSSNKNAAYIRERLDSFLATMAGKLGELSDEEFKTQVDSVLTRVSEKDKNLGEEFGRFWTELDTHKYQFDRQEREIEALKKVTKAEFQAYFDKLILKEGHRRLDVHWNSEAHRPQEEAASANQSTKFSSIPVFQQSMNLFADPIRQNYSTYTHTSK